MRKSKRINAVENTANGETIPDGFKSRLGHSESRYYSGFHHLSEESGQGSGQKSNDFAKQIIKQVMNSKINNAHRFLPFKEAKLKISKSDIYIDFTYYSLSKQKYIRQKLRTGDKKLTVAKKIEILQEACIEINRDIEIRNRELMFYDENLENVGFAKDLLFETIVPKMLQDKTLSSDRVETLKALMNNFNQFTEIHTDYLGITLRDMDDNFFNDFIAFMRKLDRAGKTINKYISIIQFISEWAVAHKMAKEVLLTRRFRVDAPKNETNRYPPLTSEEKIKTFNYFRETRPEYYLFLMCIYYTCIRPGELHRLRVRNIDFKAKTIFVPWFSSKNGLSNYVQILDPLFQVFIDFGVDKLDKDLYLFGFEDGKCCMPSMDQYTGHATSDIWSRHRDQVGLAKEKQMYGLKHTFNVDYVENNKYNIDWEWLRRHNRHATVQQTQDYISGLTAYFLDETKAQIINYHIMPNRGLKIKS